jgi:hypothetical protein
MYRYEFNGGTYVTEAGVHNASNRIQLGDGWYWAWGTFTTQATTTRLNDSGMWYYNYFPFSDKVSVAKIMLVQGNYTTLHPKYWPEVNVNRTSSNNVVDLLNTSTITATSLTYASDGTFSYNGTTDNIDLGSLSSRLGQSITICSVAKISSVVSKNALLSINGAYSFFLPGNRLTTTYQLYWDSASGWKKGNRTSWTTNQWYHFSWVI